MPIEVPYIYQKPSGCIQGTSVTMALDNPNPTKPIEAIRVGDVIQSYNPQTQQVVSAEVIEVYEYTERLPEIYLIFNNNLEVTPRQTLYRDGIGWMKANDAQIGYNIFENPPSTSEIFSVPISLKVEMPLNPSTRLYDLVIQPLTGKACGYWANGILVGGYN